jgi:hypothetical protein
MHQPKEFVMPKYEITLRERVLRTVWVEVDADDDDDAMNKAVTGDTLSRQVYEDSYECITCDVETVEQA